MSYDLYFYKRKGQKLSETEIAEYLNVNLIPATNKSSSQWFVENENTETYFSIDQNEQETDEEAVEYFDNFKEFHNTHFSFNLNFLRPDFFGQFAFPFVDKFVKDLDLFVLNPQTTAVEDKPYKPKNGELYKDWSVLNAKNCSNSFKKYSLEYYPLDKSNVFYQYNFNRDKLQNKLGENYYVPKLYLFKKKSNGSIITICTWTEHIPNVFPPADYFLLTKKYNKLSKKIEEVGLISSQTFYARFGNSLADFDFKDCKIIHPVYAEKVKETFNSTKIEHKLNKFADRVQIEKLVNVQPDE